MNMPKQTQKTQPKKGKPVEIPVPKRDTIDRLLRKAAKPLKDDDSDSTRRPSE